MLACDDGQEYVVKGRHVPRTLVNDQIVGHLGKAMEAPVGEVRLVDVPAELIRINSVMGHMPPGRLSRLPISGVGNPRKQARGRPS
jgi:hypothetical protein